jgi:hypothetical protein
MILSDRDDRPSLSDHRLTHKISDTPVQEQALSLFFNLPGGFAGDWAEDLFVPYGQ